MASRDTAASGTDSDAEAARPRRRDYVPSGGSTGTSGFAVLRRTLAEYSEDNLGDWAAALTYYGLQALFPALLALVGLLGLLGSPTSTTHTITEIVTKIGPGSAAQTFSGPIRSITAHKSAAGILGIVGLVAALWSASGYIGAFMRASNVIYETPEGRPIWKLRPLQLLITFVMVLLLALVLIAIVLTGPIVTAVASPLGIGSTAVTTWDIAKWPVLLLVIIAMFAVLFYASPNVRLVGFRWVVPGVLFAVTVWIVASALFALYVANFGSYDKTYGTLGGVVIFLIWMWLTNTALLLGMELNAERERRRELAAGVPGAERELQLDARSVPKTPKTT